MSALTPTKSWVPQVRGNSAAALLLAGIAAVLASTCCVVPLVLAVLGISGAWISQLRWLAPYSTPLMALSFAALALAGWRLFRSPAASAGACEADALACRQINSTAHRWFWLVALLALIPALVPMLAQLFY
ncbi:MAG: mercuric transporter MerT family protein [Burkholderiales bacterium]|nr:mercuric transporter MerT family protein [Burkholderiales bacterium]